MEINDRAKRWRLILGSQTDEKLSDVSGEGITLSEEEQIMADALECIYRSDANDYFKGKAGNGVSAPRLNRWLSDIRKVFDSEMVKVIETDSIEKKGLTSLLYEKEFLEAASPDINIASTLLTYKNAVPDKRKNSAREYIERVVEDINRRLETDIERAVTGALNKKEHKSFGTASTIDFNYTVRRNLKNYNKDLKTIIPERMYFYDSIRKKNKWNVIVDIDQSGSMGASVINSTIMGCILSKMSSLKTRIVSFDTSVVDLTALYEDPIDMLFGIQLGGGTDIHKSLCYCEQFIENPDETIFFLISDLEEWGSRGKLLNKIQFFKESGVKFVCMLALDDNGTPYYSKSMAKSIAEMDIPVFAATPKMIPDILEKIISGEKLVFDKS